MKLFGTLLALLVLAPGCTGTITGESSPQHNDADRDIIAPERVTTWNPGILEAKPRSSVSPCR